VLLLWHRYLAVFEGGTNTTRRLFQHGWIGLKTAATPGALATATERKLFAGAGYDATNDTVIGPPEFRLDLLFPGAAQLGACLVFSEPAVLTAVDGIYMAMKCAAASGGKIFGLRCDHSFSPGSCAYLGDFVADTEAATLNSSWAGFSAPEFAITATKTHLVVDLHRAAFVSPRRKSNRAARLSAATVHAILAPLNHSLHDAGHPRWNKR